MLEELTIELLEELSAAALFFDPLGLSLPQAFNNIVSVINTPLTIKRYIITLDINPHISISPKKFHRGEFRLRV